MTTKHPSAASPNPSSEEPASPAEPSSEPTPQPRPIDLTAHAETIQRHRRLMLTAAERELRSTTGRSKGEPTIGRTGASAEDAVQDATEKLIRAQTQPGKKRYGQPPEAYMNGGYLTTSAVNAVRSLGQGWKSEQHGVTVTSTDDDSRIEARDPEADRQLDQVEDDLSDEMFHRQALPHLDCLTARARKVYLAIRDPAVLSNEQNDLARQLKRSKTWVSRAMKEATDQLYVCIALNRCPRLKE